MSGAEGGVFNQQQQGLMTVGVEFGDSRVGFGGLCYSPHRVYQQADMMRGSLMMRGTWCFSNAWVS